VRWQYERSIRQLGMASHRAQKQRERSPSGSVGHTETLVLIFGSTMSPEINVSISAQ
jgi:hypothetical protein